MIREPVCGRPLNGVALSGHGVLDPTTSRRMRTADGDRLGEICIDAFVERFAVYPFMGTVEQVAGAWHLELRRLLDGAEAVGLPITSNMAWLLYRFGRRVLIHQTLILPGWEGEMTDAGSISKVPQYRRLSEDGEQLSEWEVSLDAVQQFVAG